MSRISIPEPSMLNEDERKQFSRFPANLTLGLLVTSCSAPGYLSLGASFPKGSLSDKDREMIILRIGSLSHSAYERMQHYPLALKAGWSEKEIELIETGQIFSEREGAILNFVDECVEFVKVKDKTFDTVKSFYNHKQLAELTLLIGHYMMTARFLETLEIPLDQSATSWDGMSV